MGVGVAVGVGLVLGVARRGVAVGLGGWGVAVGSIFSVTAVGATVNVGSGVGVITRPQPANNHRLNNHRPNCFTKNLLILQHCTTVIFAVRIKIKKRRPWQVASPG